MGALPARPLARTTQVSLVEVSPSTVMRLNVLATIWRSMSWSTAPSMAQSVVTAQSMVPMLGWIMPEPLAMAPTVTVLPPISVVTAISLIFRSVVRMAWAASLDACSVSARAATRAGTPASMAVMFSSTPMMPVEQTAKSWGARPVAAAAAAAMRLAFSMPLGAQALALPLSRMMPWAL